MRTSVLRWRMPKVGSRADRREPVATNSSHVSLFVATKVARRSSGRPPGTIKASRPPQPDTRPRACPRGISGLSSAPNGAWVPQP